MAETQKDRLLANRLRTQKTIGKKPLTDEQAKWLDAYELRTAKAKGSKSAHKPAASSPRPTVRGPQLAIAGSDVPVSSAVQETKPLADRIDATAHVWTPTAPEAPADAPPPPPGAPPAPEAGTPLVGNDTPQGGPQTAMLVKSLAVGVVAAGIVASGELLDTLDVPFLPKELLEAARAGLRSDEARKKLCDDVGDSAAKVSLARGWAFADGVMTDEGKVLAALAASGTAIFLNTKRKQALPEGKKAEQLEKRDDGYGKADPNNLDAAMREAFDFDVGKGR